MSADAIRADTVADTSPEDLDTLLAAAADPLTARAG